MSDASSRFTWLHLADLHLRDSISWDSNFVLQGLLRDVGGLSVQLGAQPDAIFVSGDLTFSGQAKEFTLVRDFIGRLTDVAEVPLRRCFFVPGNHDVDRTRVTPVGTAVRDKLFREHADQFVADLFSDESSREILFSPLSSYAAFVPEQCKISAARPFYVSNIQKEGLPFPICVIGLNSAWLAYDEGPAIVGRRQIQEAIDEVKQNSFVVAVIHHPISSLLEWDQTSVADIIDHHCDVLLRGHLHRTRLEIASASAYRCSQIAAGGTYTGGRAQNGYNAVVVDFAERHATAFLRHYRPDGGGSWVEDNIFRDPAPGQFRWTLPERFARVRTDEVRKTPTVEGEERRIVWISLESVSKGQEIDAAEAIQLLGAILRTTTIVLRNVQTGSLWLELEMPLNAYLRLLDLRTSEDKALFAFGKGYRVAYVGPQRPRSLSADAESESSRYRKVRIFVASPSDVRDERTSVARVVEELNKTVADQKGLVLEVLRWETDAVPGIGRPQDLINSVLARADVVIGILATRFGSPTGVAGSGTQEEFDLAYDSWGRSGRPKIMFYFKNQGTVFRSREQLDQMGKVLEFRDRLGKTALFWEFASTSEFEAAIRQHLSRVILEETARSHSTQRLPDV